MPRLLRAVREVRGLALDYSIGMVRNAEGWHRLRRVAVPVLHARLGLGIGIGPRQ
jgi:hypothetical protein